MTHRTRIALVIRSLELAGAENMVTNLALGLHELGEPVVVVSLLDIETPLSQRLEAAGIPVVFLGKKKGLDPSLWKRLRDLFVEYGVGVVHSHLSVLKYTVPAVLGVPWRPAMVHTFHSLATYETASKLSRLFNAVSFKLAHVVPVALNPEVADSISNEYGMPRSSIPVVYNGIDVARYAATDVRRREGDSNIRLLHVARFAPAKRHETVLEAFCQALELAPCLRLTFVGDGDLRAAIEQRVKDLGLCDKVEFAGVQSDVAPYYAKSDIFILPSKYEGSPMSIVEAMASGLPVIATAVGGVPQLVEDGVSGILVDQSVESLVDAIVDLSRDKDTRRRLGRNAQEKAQVYSIANMALGYRELYKGSHDGNE